MHLPSCCSLLGCLRACLLKPAGHGGERATLDCSLRWRRTTLHRFSLTDRLQTTRLGVLRIVVMIVCQFHLCCGVACCGAACCAATAAVGFESSPQSCLYIGILDRVKIAMHLGCVLRGIQSRERNAVWLGFFVCIALRGFHAVVDFEQSAQGKEPKG